MECAVCRKKATTDFRHLRPLCDNCFSRAIEKRLRKYIRLNRLIRKGDRLLVIDDFSHYFLNKIVKDLPIKIFKKSISLNLIINDEINIKSIVKKHRINKILLPWTLDTEGTAFLQSYFKNKKMLILPKSHIKFLKAITEEEADVFAIIHKIKRKKITIDKKINEFINKIEKINPGAKFGLARSSEKFEELGI